MAEGLEAIAGDRAKELISKFTTNRYAVASAKLRCDRYIRDI